MEKRVVNRETTCPFLIRVFYREDLTPIAPESLQDRGDQLCHDEVRIYTWIDASLREVIDLLKEQLPAARRRDAEFRLSFVRPNLHGGLERKDLGVFYAARKTAAEADTLQQLRFVIGDYIGVNITHQLK
mmetsp:Transcript_31918/g.54982  ORF Transcript_31918/g.54982 Transcript_31918/m.54982 type:complete len:130 (-) Transcript_31918:19-408(-)